MGKITGDKNQKRRQKLKKVKLRKNSIKNIFYTFIYPLTIIICALLLGGVEDIAVAFVTVKWLLKVLLHSEVMVVVVVVIVKGEEEQELEDIVMEELLERLFDLDATEPDVSRGFLGSSLTCVDCFSLNALLESCEESEGSVFIISEGVNTLMC